MEGSPVQYGWIRGSNRPICIPEGLHAGQEIFEPLAKLAGLRLMVYSPEIFLNDEAENAREVHQLLNEKPVLLIIPTSIRIDREFVKTCAGRVSMFATVSTGTDHVDLELLGEVGIPFLHAPGINAVSVAQYVLSAMPLFFDSDRLLRGNLEVGIVGYGNVGRALGRYLELLNIPYVYCDPFLSEKFKPVSLDRALDSDLVTFHVPLTTEGDHPTFRMIDRSRIETIRKGAVVMNAARGGIFSEDSYFHTCHSHRTLMDVFPIEPPTIEMVRAATYATPHIAGYNFEARVGGSETVARGFASKIGMTEEIPEAKIPVFDHNVVDFLALESKKFKDDPESFSGRRSRYPSRGSFRNYDLNADPGPFLKKVIEIDRGMNWKRTE